MQPGILFWQQRLKPDLTRYAATDLQKKAMQAKGTTNIGTFFATSMTENDTITAIKIA